MRAERSSHIIVIGKKIRPRKKAVNLTTPLVQNHSKNAVDPVIYRLSYFSLPQLTIDAIFKLLYYYI
jgi:hypothetical protein